MSGDFIVVTFIEHLSFTKHSGHIFSTWMLGDYERLSDKPVKLLSSIHAEPGMVWVMIYALVCNSVWCTKEIKLQITLPIEMQMRCVQGNMINSCLERSHLDLFFTLFWTFFVRTMCGSLNSPAKPLASPSFLVKNELQKYFDTG